MEVSTQDKASIAATVPDTKRAAADTKINEDEPPKTALPLPTDEEKIQKAVSFLGNGDIDNVPASAKREFLEKKVGLNRDEVDLAMERAARRAGIGRFDDKRDIERRSGDGRYGDDAVRGRGIRRGYEDDYRDERHQYNDRYERDQNRFDRRGPYDSPLQHQPNYYGSNNTSHHHNGPHPDQMDEHEKSSFSFTSWAGGFSLGVFCLAALRWLNGGDFILFPPPTAADRLIQKESRSSDAEAEESGEIIGQQGEATTLLEDIIEEDTEEAEDDYEMNDEALTSILNGTSNVQNLHPTESQPSYEDLVLEIRTLTSAVHSYREEQERTNRAAAAKVGKGVTDDVMDFLREDKNKSKENNGAALSKSEVENMNIGLLLNEIAGDLHSLKDSISSSSKIDKPDAEKDEGSEPRSDQTVGLDAGVETLSNESYLLTYVGNLIGKLQKAMDLLEPKENETAVAIVRRESLSEVSPVATEEANSAADAETATGETTLEVSQQSNEPSGSTVEQTSDPTSCEEGQDNNDQSDQVEPETSDETKSTTFNVEQALRTLSNSNSVDELKAGSQMLYLYCMNISKNPTVPRYRKIYTNNKTFQQKVGNLTGADELLSSVGFVKKSNFFEWSEQGDSSSDIKSSLDLALVALDMMRKGTQTAKQTSSPTDCPDEVKPNATTLSDSKVVPAAE